MDVEEFSWTGLAFLEVKRHLEPGERTSTWNSMRAHVSPNDISRLHDGGYFLADNGVLWKK
jgi:nitrous oxidase accessory protein NosD